MVGRDEAALAEAFARPLKQGSLIKRGRLRKVRVPSSS